MSSNDKNVVKNPSSPAVSTQTEFPNKTSKQAEYTLKHANEDAEYSGIYKYKAPLAGGCAGITGTILGFPLDSAKVRLQTAVKTKTYYSSAGHVLKDMWAEGKLGAVYKGVGAPIAALCVLFAINFGTYDTVRRKLEDYLGFESYGIHSIAGGFAGGISALVGTPFEVVKVKAQIDNVAKQRYDSSYQVAKHIVEKKGFKSLYRGATMQVARDVGFGMFYFYVYQLTRDIIKEKAVNHSPWWQTAGIPIGGALAGAVSWAVVFPIDVVKTNLQIRSEKARILPIAVKLWKQGGLKTYYGGLAPCIGRALAVHATRLSTYEFVMWGVEKFRLKFDNNNQF
mmetsp:Transcript_10266/g.17242  ORF Transcript_10266/g.17242 Transcript_10266/m.17242 type:complete len:339 (+) Transcript_10266:80-1096(+)